MLIMQLSKLLVHPFLCMQNCKIHHSVVGLRSCISEGAIIEDTLLMGADYYEVVLRENQQVLHFDLLNVSIVLRISYLVVIFGSL